MNLTERKAEIRGKLESARDQTLRLLDFVPDDLLKVRVHDFYSPVGWHFGHIGMTEEHWVIIRALRGACLNDTLSFLFANLPDNPKDNRIHLPSREEIRGYLAATRRCTLQALDEADLAADDPLLADGYAWEFAHQHECQHQETIAEMLQLLQKQIAPPAPNNGGAGSTLDGSPPAPPLLGAGGASTGDMVEIPGGAFIMGSNDRHGYDNEKKEHRVEVAPFSLDRTPVTAVQWLQFLEDGGYRRPDLWTADGWAWREREGAEHPEYWLLAGGDYLYYGPQGPRALYPNEPVTSVGWYEADAYARWAGKRLPTEAEWEYAAAHDPAADASWKYPWGAAPPDESRASFGLDDWAPAPVGSKPAGANALGLLDMAGGVWEWTATPFLPYPGFRAFPYDGYSKDHMDGGHFVCRGGSWATAAPLLRCSFRNWYVPTYRQGFLGLRCAR